MTLLQMMKQHPQAAQVDLDALVACIKECSTCEAACVSCADACLSEEGLQDLDPGLLQVAGLLAEEGLAVVGLEVFVDLAVAIATHARRVAGAPRRASGVRTLCSLRGGME